MLQVIEKAWVTDADALKPVDREFLSTSKSSDRPGHRQAMVTMGFQSGARGFRGFRVFRVFWVFWGFWGF